MEQLVVRPLTSEEGPRWNELVSTHHYRKDATLVGEPLCYVAEYPGTWLALLGWAAPARHLRPRDEWAGWSAEPLACRRDPDNPRYYVAPAESPFPRALVEIDPPPVWSPCCCPGRTNPWGQIPTFCLPSRASTCAAAADGPAPAPGPA